MAKLSADRIDEIFKDCLFNDGEPTEPHVKAEGITMSVGFHPQRLQSHATEITEMLRDLPVEFQENTGGGMSFLNACMDRDGQQWGEHSSMQQLFQLGIGIGRVKCLMPRDMWDVLPGGMPYYVVTEHATPTNAVDPSAQHRER